MKNSDITELSAAQLAAIRLPDDWVGARSTPTIQPQTDPHAIRLQKALAAAGVASRRACESLISKGRVRVNGKIVTEMGTKIVPGVDEVRVDAVVVQLDTTLRYFVLNKPVGVVSSMSDDKGRPDLTDYTANITARVYNVGRLDYDTSGLLILTNDGELANQLAHPKYGVTKTYLAKVRGKITPAKIQQLKNGITLEDGFIQADHIKILTTGASTTHSLVELSLHSGRNRIVRRMLAAVGHPVTELHRKQFGPLNLGTLPSGEIRELSAAERGALLTAASSNGKTPRSGRRKITAGRPGDGAGAHGMHGIARATKTRSQASGKTGSKKSAKNRPQTNKNKQHSAPTRRVKGAQ